MGKRHLEKYTFLLVWLLLRREILNGIDMLRS